MRKRSAGGSIERTGGAYKHPSTTVLAFRDAAPPSARLLIAGACRSASIREAITQAAGDDRRIEVRFGFLSNDDLVAALCAADWSICPYLAIDNPGVVNLTVSYDCPVIAPAFPAVRELTLDHPAILYPADGPTRSGLADAIAAASKCSRISVPAHRTSGMVTRRQQAEQTIEQYVAARNGANRNPRQARPVS